MQMTADEMLIDLYGDSFSLVDDLTLVKKRSWREPFMHPHENPIKLHDSPVPTIEKIFCFCSSDLVP